MAAKRTAREAFGKERGQLSAVAAAKLARQKAPPPAPNATAQEPDPIEFATAVGEQEYDGRHDTSPPPPSSTSADEPHSKAQTRKPAVRLSTFDVKKAVPASDYYLDTEIRLSLHETVTAVGEYDVLVISGIATIYGAILRPETGRKRVYAPSTQALPQLQARQDGTRLRLCTVGEGMRKLGKLSPLFGNTWADDKPSFALLNTSHDDPLQRTLTALETDQDTEAVLRTLSAKIMVEPRKPRIMGVGAKSAGKSTFNRILCNHILSWTPVERCQYLDLDPGQPEFGPSGQVSLTEVGMPLLGPAYTHLANGPSQTLRTVRSHTIGATTFKHDPEHYRDCALDLIRRVDANLPLIINSCGWINGLGASILTELVPLLQISDIVFLEPIEEDLIGSFKSAAAGCSLYRIPRQPPRPSSRTPAEQRAMQTMAYFHQRLGTSEVPRFSSKPLSNVRHYVVSYAGAEQSILGVASYGQAPKSEFLSEVLDGSLVALVVLEPGYADTFEVAFSRTPENVTYLLPAADGTTRTLDPKHSSCVGLALVRGLDTTNSTLHLVSPLGEDQMARLAKKEVVFVRGGFDSPEWAYLEDLYSDDHGDAAASDRPWVSKREMVGVEGAVWRLRHPPLAPSQPSNR